MSLTGRPRSPPFLLVSSAQICIASSPEVPLTARPPVKGMLKPIVTGAPDGVSAWVPSDAVRMTATAAAMAVRADLPGVLGRNMFPLKISVFAKLHARFPHPRCQRPDIGEDGIDEAGLGGVVGLEVERETLYQGGADNGGVGGVRHGSGLFRGPDAEADPDRQPGEPA